MTDRQFCPRSAEDGGGPNSPMKPPFNGEMTWREDGTCSYCGSISEEAFFEAVERGALVTPTDKNYKVYIDGKFPQRYRDCLPDARCSGPNDCDHWVTREVDQAKFYLQHLSDEGKDRFIRLVNEKKMKLAEPGYFYVPPFFAIPK